MFLRLVNTLRPLGSNLARDQDELVNFDIDTILNTFLAKPLGVPFFGF